MADLPESNEWTAGIYQLETSDPVLGGPEGIDNQQAKQLANRTKWLKDQLQKLIDGVTAVGKATKLANARNLKFKGAASGSGSFDGSADTEITLALADSGVSAGSYTKVTINAKGLATGGSNPTSLEGSGITDAVSMLNTASDYNTLSKTGLYELGSSTTANRPDSFNGSGALNHLMGDYSFTLAYDLAADGVAFRRKTAEGFGPWRYIWHSGSFDPIQKANLASPVFTGTPTAPTASAGTNNLQLSNTAYVWSSINTYATTVNSALGLKANLASPAFTGIPTVPTAGIGTSTLQAASTEFVQTSIGEIDPWAMQPIGVPIALFYHLASGSTPPLNKGYRYISLTANDTYNGGVLTGEVVSGSSPLVTATAVISLAGSPINGKTINLINTEQRLLRGSPTPGQLLQDAQQNITGSMTTALVNSATGAFSFSRDGGGATIGVANSAGTVTLDTSQVVRTSNETRVKTIGVFYFMRIK